MPPSAPLLCSLHPPLHPQSGLFHLLCSLPLYCLLDVLGALPSVFNASATRIYSSENWVGKWCKSCHASLSDALLHGLRFESAQDHPFRLQSIFRIFPRVFNTQWSRHGRVPTCTNSRMHADADTFVISLLENGTQAALQLPVDTRAGRK